MTSEANGERVAMMPDHFPLPGIGLDRIFNTAPIGLCVFDDQLRFVYLNQAFAALNGVPIADHLGRTPMEVVPDLGIQAESALRKILETGEPLLNFEVVGETPADPGVSHVWEESWEPVRNHEGRIVGISVAAVDVTQRRKTQAQLRESEAEARRLVEKLRREDQNKNSFISSLSHELRNPLAAIVSSLDILDRSFGGDDRLNHIHDIIRRQTNQLTHLVNDLLDVTRINGNKLSLLMQPVDMIALIEAISTDHSQRYCDKNIGVDFRTDATWVRLMGDPIRLTQAIGNLIDNACKFSRAGDRTTVVLRKDMAAREAVVSIVDNGIGLTADQINSLFQPFYQVKQLPGSTHVGLGLGLSIVKGIVELHGGRITVASEGIGKGSMFTIHLPILDEPAPSA